MSEVHEQNIQLRNTVDEIHDVVAHQGRLIKDLRESLAEAQLDQARAFNGLRDDMRVMKLVLLFLAVLNTGWYFHA